MVDKIQLLLSLQVLGFCVFGGITLLLRAEGNRAKRILGWSMLLWAFLAGVRLSVNLYIEGHKEVFNPAVLLTGCLVTASLSCYVIEVLRPGYLTLKRFFLYLSPVMACATAYLVYRLAGGEAGKYYSIWEVAGTFHADIGFRVVIFGITLVYMILPVYLILRYSKGFTAYLMENVADPEDYDLAWLRKIMITLSIMYLFYILLLLTDSAVLYVIDKATILLIWYYLFYKALFLKVIPLEHSFEKGWGLPYQTEEEPAVEDESSHALCKQYAEDVKIWFQKEKPYLRDDLRLTDLQRVFPISRSYLSQLFNRELGCSFSDYVNSLRVEESKRLLAAEPEASILEIAERSGFHSISTFRRAFVKHTGSIPSDYRKG